MSPDRKATTARILGYVCVAVGVLNLVLGALRATGQRDSGLRLLMTGIAALTIGLILMITSRRKPSSGE